MIEIILIFIMMIMIIVVAMTIMAMIIIGNKKLFSSVCDSGHFYHVIRKKASHPEFFIRTFLESLKLE